MVSQSAQLDRRTKQHTQFGVSASNGSRDMARTKSWRKKKKKEKKEKRKKKKNERRQSHIESATGIANNETGSRSACMRPRSDPPKMKKSTSDKIVAKKKNNNNEANWMVSNSAKLHHRTKQHTQFVVSASNGSRYMVRTKSWRKKKITKRIGC